MPEKHALTINNRRMINGEWEEMTGAEIPLENGVGISNYSKLLYIDEDRLYNPATNDVLYRTRKDKESGKTQHYYSRATGILVNAYLVTEVDGET